MQTDPPTAPTQDTVWTVDLIKTLPGQQANYIRSIENNWAGARHLARERGAVLSYQAFAAPQDSTRGWDVILMTEYADSTQWANRETTFEAIFESDAFVFIDSGVPSAEMREFAIGDVAMQSFVNQ